VTSSRTEIASTGSESGVRQRTRTAVVDAALKLWAADFSASLSDIADAASVSRSTLHRYFPDRQTLVDATLQHALTALEEAYGHSVVDRTTGREQLESLLRSTVDVADAVLFLYADPHRFDGNEHWPDEDSDHGDLTAVIEQAQREGDIATDVDPRWVVNVFYALVYVAAEGVSSGYLSRHRAADLAVRAFLGAVRPAG
jgi:AcrR family transcriptional regulator